MWRITCEPSITTWPTVDMSIMKQFASDQLGVKNSTVQHPLSWGWVWLSQIPTEEGESKGIPWQCYREIETWVLIHAMICLFMETLSILELPFCSGRKCCVRSGCLPKDAEASGVMSWQLPEIAYQLLGAQVRPPTLFWKKLFVQLLLSSKLCANPLKSNS